MRQSRRLTLIAALIVVGFIGTIAWTYFSDRPQPLETPLYLARPVEETGAINRVTGIYLNYRLLDTLLEVLVFSVAILGIQHYLARSKAVRLPRLMESEVVRTAVSLLSPLAFLLSLFFVLFGHLSPGGGFASGVIAASGLLYVGIALGMKEAEQRLSPKRLGRVEKGVLLLLIAYVLFPVLLGRTPLTDLLPRGTPGHLLSGGSILIYNLLIASKVLIGAWIAIVSFAQHRGEL